VNTVKKINIVLKRRIRQGIFNVFKVDTDNIRKGIIRDDNYYLNYYGSDFEGEDIRGYWEDNRLQDLLPKAIEYSKNKDEELSQVIIRNLKDWEKNNIYLYGKNWICAMEAGIRLANLSLISYYLKESEIYNNEVTFFRNLIISHYKFIKNNLEVTLRSPLNNHYLSDIAGLLYAFCFFPDYIKNKSYKRILAEELEEQIHLQVLKDGVSFENSTGYHKYVLELFLYTGMVCSKCGIELSKEYWNKVGKMLNFAESYTRPDRNAPSLGDSDDGYWHKFSGNMISNSHYHLVDIKKRFQDKDSAIEYDSLSSFINDYYPDEVKRNALLKDSNDTYTEGGVYVHKEDKLYLIITSRNSDGNILQYHKHNDIFSFELFYDGIPFIVDPGTYTYTKDVKIRNIFRSTGYHNTLKINNIEQQDLSKSGLFALPREGVVNANVTSNENAKFVFNGEYCNNKIGTHKRFFEFNRVENILKLKDEIKGSGRLFLEWYFHLHNDIVIRSEKNNVFLEKNNVKIIFKYPVRLNFEIREEFMSESFNKKSVSKVLYFCGKYDESECIEEFMFKF